VAYNFSSVIPVNPQKYFSLPVNTSADIRDPVGSIDNLFALVIPPVITRFPSNGGHRSDENGNQAQGNVFHGVELYLLIGFKPLLASLAPALPLSVQPTKSIASEPPSCGDAGQGPSTGGPTCNEEQYRLAR